MYNIAKDYVLVSFNFYNEGFNVTTDQHKPRPSYPILAFDFIYELKI